jgi:hypothetical protein
MTEHEVDPLIGLTITLDHFESPTAQEGRGGNNSQVLPIAELPLDWLGDPLDGEQYLFMVRCVRRKCLGCC